MHWLVCAGLGDLEFLYLERSPVDDLTPLSGLDRLSVLYLRDCREVSDVSALASLPRLHTLDVAGAAPGLDLAPLAGNKKLTVYIVAGQEVRGGEALGRRLKVSPRR
ncbi:leucine-rich repeat domain-containing protein [Actinomadura napierensis]|uniref:Leucine-rich repeat domain-containing protein n=1 Tax=Actinomadura napierensis TaxID=267854 RepID=A0ABN3A262_9ACTN